MPDQYFSDANEITDASPAKSWGGLVNRVDAESNPNRGIEIPACTDAMGKADKGTQFHPEWHFFANGEGGFFRYVECPEGRPECASYGMVKCGEDLKGTGMGWQCENLQLSEASVAANPKAFYCKLLPKGACIMCGKHGDKLCKRHLNALVKLALSPDDSADVVCPACGKQFLCSELREIYEAMSEVDKEDKNV